MRKPFFFVILAFFSLRLAAQHPLVGTWEMISIRGVSAEGKKFSLDTSDVREIKIITPTHYMLIAQDVNGDSLVFNRCYAGKVTIDGNRYLETPIQASLQIFENVKTDFTWKIEGDIFIQSGSITRPDGKKIILEALRFRRVKGDKKYPNNPAIGTWSQVSSSYTDFDGTKGLDSKDSAASFQLITPTHWMRISSRANNFEYAMGGTYEVRNGKTIARVVVASSRFPGTIEVTDSVSNNRLSQKGILTRPDGKTVTWDDVFERLIK